MEYKSFRYVRNANTEPFMKVIMERLAKEVDEYEAALDKEEYLNKRGNGNNNSMMMGYNESAINFSQIVPQPYFNTHSQLLTPKKNENSLEISTILKGNERGK